jgi:methionyl-tRNA synthetase
VPGERVKDKPGVADGQFAEAVEVLEPVTAESAADEAGAAFQALEFSKGLESIWRIVGLGNRYIDEQGDKAMKIFVDL